MEDLAGRAEYFVGGKPGGAGAWGAGGTDGGGGKGVQLSGTGRHFVGVFDDGGKAQGSGRWGR